MRARHHLTLVLALLLAGCGGGSDSFVQTGGPLNPRGQNCRYTLIKDDQDQAYHQYAFDGLDGLAAAVTPQCAELLDEN